MPPRNNADYAYLLHMVSCMKEGSGRMAAVVSGGVLSRGGQEGRIRLRLVADSLVDTVIALPEKMFDNTSVAGAILIMRRGRTANNVLFVDARALGDGARNKNAFPDAALKKIADICAARLAVPGLSAVAGPDEIAAHGHSLSVPLYVRPGQENTAPAIPDLLRRRTEVREQLAAVDREIAALLDTIARAQQKTAPSLEPA
jgi:type I restriction enzyme M protein